jgi:CRISPR-associated protein Csb1
LIALRRLNFPTRPGGEAFAAAEQARADLAARTALAALGVAALVLLAQEGHDLRSRCVLVPEGPLVLELVSPHGDAPVRVSLTPAQAVELVNAAASQAAAAGLPWDKAALTLTPSPKLSGLIRESRKQAMQGAVEAEA